MENWFRNLVIGTIKLIAQPIANRFTENLNRPKNTQDHLLNSLLKQYNKSNYSKNYGMISTYREFKDNLPIISYEDIKDQLPGLNVEKIVCYEATSGSSSKAKQIPYTKQLLGSFQKMFLIWFMDIIKLKIPFKSYRFYFSISPFFEEETPSGLQDDSDYLGPWLRPLGKFFFNSPPVKKARNKDEFLMYLALGLMSDQKLEIISIWSPTFLLNLLSYIEKNENEIKEYLFKGQYKDFHFDKRNWSKGEDYFPSLKFISCWGSSSAKVYFDYLVEDFPGIFIQPKGLLATEAPLTIPMGSPRLFVPLISEVFFEFIDNQGEVKRLHELKDKTEYELIISQKGGLYRYRMGDMIKVDGYKGRTPCLDFIGRKNQTSDLVGEKLSEDFLLNIQKELCKINYTLCALVPNQNQIPFYSVLFSGKECTKIQECFEKYLSDNPHYQYARSIGQLGPCQFYFHEDGQALVQNYLTEVKKMKLGDIKPTLLFHTELDGRMNQFIESRATSSTI